MSLLFLKLLLAHLVGDFLLQPDKWVADKKKRKAASPYLYLHLCVHALLLLLLLQFNVHYWRAIVIIVTSHFLIDVAKLYLQNSWPEKYLFITDQLLHLLLIVAAVHIYQPITVDVNILHQPKIILAGVCIVAVTYVIAIVMRLIMNHWDLKEDNKEDSLKNAGKYIGMIERLLVFIFVVLGQWGAIGFLIAAKSILRFSDLSRAKDRKLTEYVIIGTLLSIAMAIVVGLVYNKLK